MPMINLREYAAGICNKFENLLDNHDISIPDSGRLGEECEARLYGCTYYNLEQEVYEILKELCSEMIEAQRNSIELYPADSWVGSA